MGENPFASGPIKLMIGGEVVEVNDTTLKIMGMPGDPVGEKGDEWKPLDKSFDIECNGLVSDNLADMLPPMEDMALEIKNAPGKMPRKMKKALKTNPQRNTKWWRKVQNYINRNTFRASHARLEITDQDESTVTATISFDSISRI